MATFRIHEDIDSGLDAIKVTNAIANTKNNGNDKEKRATFAVLNNIAYDGRTHAPKLVSLQQNVFELLYEYAGFELNSIAINRN